MSILDAVLVYVVWFAVAFVGSACGMLVLNYKDAKRERAFRAEQRRHRLLLEELDEETWGEVR